jgi:uncharacterized sulfatase
MATACDLAGAAPPPGLDSISFLPTLLGRADQQEQHRYLYWEFYERGGRRAVRSGNWKAVRPLWSADIELYDLASDIGEQRNLAERHPEIVKRLAAMMDEAHSPSPDWTPPQ